MASRMLGFINRTFIFKSKDMILPLSKSMVRAHLEYAVQFWDPHLSKYIKLEALQQRANKLIHLLRYKTYEERLQNQHFFFSFKIIGSGES